MSQIRAAQVLLVIAAGGLWAASRLPWASVQSFDGLGQPRTVTVDGAAWSTALIPLAVLLLAAALAALSLRGWALRAVAVLVAAVTAALIYLGASLMVMRDVGPRAAALAEVPVMHLVGSDRYLAGAAITVAAAVCALLAAVLLLRAGGANSRPPVRYAATAAGRSATSGSDEASEPGVSERGMSERGMSERGMWDALDAGRDPTDTEGR